MTAAVAARVLVVDDEPPVGALLSDMLAHLGYTAQVARTGADALRLLADFRPDVVLLDLALPEMPGEVVLDRLRTIDPGLPVIMVTGNANPDLARRTLRSGAFDYVTKPFDLARLARVVEAAIVQRG
jgi:DNA-binding NtrC family response regulator